MSSGGTQKSFNGEAPPRGRTPFPRLLYNIPFLTEKLKVTVVYNMYTFYRQMVPLSQT